MIVFLNQVENKYEDAFLIIFLRLFCKNTEGGLYDVLSTFT